MYLLSSVLFFLLLSLNVAVWLLFLVLKLFSVMQTYVSMVLLSVVAAAWYMMCLVSQLLTSGQSFLFRQLQFLLCSALLLLLLTFSIFLFCVVVSCLMLGVHEWLIFMLFLLSTLCSMLPLGKHSFISYLKFSNTGQEVIVMSSVLPDDVHFLFVLLVVVIVVLVFQISVCVCIRFASALLGVA